MNIDSNNFIPKKRNTNIELLRILIMVLIIMSHYACHGGAYDMADGLNKYIAAGLTLGGKISVDIFIMITGYYMVNSDFKFIRIIRLELTVIFYSIVFYLIACLLWKTDTWNFLSIRNSLLPTITNMNDAYWFIPEYIAIILIAPFVNIVVERLSKKIFKILLMILLIAVSIIPSIFFCTPIYDGNISTFIFLYLFGGYLKKYGTDIKIKRAVLIIAFIGIWIVHSILLINLRENLKLSVEYGLFPDMLRQCNYILTIISATCIFLFFLRVHISYVGFINKIASNVVAIYLIHDNKYFRQYAWNNIFKTYNFFDSKYMFVHAFVCTMIIFISCCVIEGIRKRLVSNFVGKIEKSSWIVRIDNLLNYK